MPTPQVDRSGSPSVEAVRRSLRTDGYGVVRSHVDAGVVDLLREETEALLGRFAAGDRSEDSWHYADASTGEAMLYRIHNLEKQGGSGCAELFRGGLLHDLAVFLIGSNRATVCAMVVKTPGVAGVPWHRDRTDVGPGAAINLSLFLDPATSGNGCIEAVPGSHLLDDDADVTQTRERGPVEQVPAGPGDVLAHDVRLVHGSGDNRSDMLRRSIVIEFAQTG